MIPVYRTLSLLSRLAGCCVLALALTGCNNDPTSPTVNVGFQTVDVRIGTGAEAILGKTIAVHLQGWLYTNLVVDHKGTQFATTIGGEPLPLTLAEGQLIPGLVRGLPGMKVGGFRRIVIPPDLAFGSQGNGSIPGDATLIFDVELISVN
jgi:FKBP-type peptidyl-prolyl cis-trans isomerase FkpA